MELRIYHKLNADIFCDSALEKIRHVWTPIASTSTSESNKHTEISSKIREQSNKTTRSLLEEFFVRSNFPAHLFVIGHASHSLPIPDVFWTMPEPEAVHLLRRPDLHLVVEFSQLYRWMGERRPT